MYYILTHSISMIFHGYQHRWIWVTHGSSTFSDVWHSQVDSHRKHGPGIWPLVVWRVRGHLETIWLASITATVSTVSHGFHREPSIWLTQVVWVFGLTCENRCTVIANPGIMQRKRDEKSGTNVSTNVLSCSFYDSRVQLVALGGMSNMLNTGFLSCTSKIELGWFWHPNACANSWQGRIHVYCYGKCYDLVYSYAKNLFVQLPWGGWSGIRWVRYSSYLLVR